MTRGEAQRRLRDVGGIPGKTVTWDTDYLVTGRTNLAVVGSTGLSKKTREAQERWNVKIVDEDTFLAALEEAEEDF